MGGPPLLDTAIRDVLEAVVCFWGPQAGVGQGKCGEARTLGELRKWAILFKESNNFCFDM